MIKKIINFPLVIWFLALIVLMVTEIYIDLKAPDNFGALLGMFVVGCYLINGFFYFILRIIFSLSNLSKLYDRLLIAYTVYSILSVFVLTFLYFFDNVLDGIYLLELLILALMYVFFPFQAIPIVIFIIVVIEKIYKAVSNDYSEE